MIRYLGVRLTAGKRKSDIRIIAFKEFGPNVWKNYEAIEFDQMSDEFKGLTKPTTVGVEVVINPDSACPFSIPVPLNRKARLNPEDSARFLPMAMSWELE